MARSKSPSSKTKGMSAGNGQATAATPALDPVSAVSGIETSPETRKIDVKKNDSRGNVVPINLEEEIRRRAYELAEKRGFQGGSETEDWLTAEREVMQRYHQQSA
jgi:Protein of unknown function (DUF2934)